MAKKAKMPTDLNQRAKAIVDFATSDEEDPAPKDAVRAASGAKGGKSRADSLSPARRKEIAEQGAQARWDAQPDQ